MSMEDRVQMAQKEGEPCLIRLTLQHRDNCCVPQSDHVMLQGVSVIAMLAEKSREGDKGRGWRQSHSQIGHQRNGNWNDRHPRTDRRTH